MGQFYGRLPSELLDLTLDDFRLNWACWYNYELEKKRQHDELEAELELRRASGG